MASNASKRNTRTTTSGRSRNTEGRRAKGQSDAARGTAGGEGQGGGTRKRSPQGGGSSRGSA